MTEHSASAPAPRGHTAAFSAAPFTLDTAVFRRLGYRIVDLVSDYLETLPTEPVFQPMPETCVAPCWSSPCLKQTPTRTRCSTCLCSG